MTMVDRQVFDGHMAARRVRMRTYGEKRAKLERWHLLCRPAAACNLTARDNVLEGCLRA